MASEDRILKILIQIQSDISDLAKVSSGVKDLKKDTDDAAKSGFSLGDAFKFAGAGEALQAVVDYVHQIPVAFEEAIKQGVEFQSELQQLQVGIAAALRQNEPTVFGSFQEAMAASGEIIDLLKAKANELGLSYQQQFEAYQHSVNAMLGGGVTDVQKQIDLIITLNAAIKTLGLSASVTARDINDMLIGNASRTIAGRQLAAGMGFPDATELDKAITQARALGTEYEFFTQHMTGFAEAIQAQATTFNASLQRMQNALLDFKGEMAKPIMQPLVDAMQSLTAAASDDAIKAFARTLGDIVGVAISVAKGVAGVASEIASLAERIRELYALVPGSELVSLAASGYKGAFDLNVQAIQAENLQKQYDLLHKQVLEAGAGLDAEKAKAAQEQVNASLGEAIASVQEKIFSGQIKNVDAAKSFLDNVKWLQQAFTLIAGTAAQVTPHLQDQSKWLEAIQKIQNQIALSNAEAGGDTAAIASARWQQAYDAAVKLLTPLAQTKEQEGEIYTLAQQVADAIYGQVTAQRARKDSQSELKDMLSQESLLLQDIRHQQEEISQNPFLGADAKTTLLNQAYQQERTELEQNIAKLQEYIAQEKQVGSPEAQAKVTELIAKLHALGFTLDELKFKIQETTFGGQIQGDLAKWVNSFGTAAQQIANTIKGSINAALQSTNQLLLDGVFHTGNWQQTVIGLERNILNLFLTLLEQMALKEAASLLGITTTQAASTASGAATAVAWAPASAAVNTATYGASALEGGAITIAEIAAIEGAVGVAHAGEIVTPGGARSPSALPSKNERIYKLLVGEGVFTEEQMANMFVPPQATHKFSTDQLEALGRIDPKTYPESLSAGERPTPNPRFHGGGPIVGYTSSGMPLHQSDINEFGDSAYNLPPEAFPKGTPASPILGTGFPEGTGTTTPTPTGATNPNVQFFEAPGGGNYIYNPDTGGWRMVDAAGRTVWSTDTAPASVNPTFQFFVSPEGDIVYRPGEEPTVETPRDIGGPSIEIPGGGPTVETPTDPFAGALAGGDPGSSDIPPDTVTPQTTPQDRLVRPGITVRDIPGYGQPGATYHPLTGSYSFGAPGISAIANYFEGGQPGTQALALAGLSNFLDSGVGAKPIGESNPAEEVLGPRRAAYFAQKDVNLPPWIEPSTGGGDKTYPMQYVPGSLLNYSPGSQGDGSNTQFQAAGVNPMGHPAGALTGEAAWNASVADQYAMQAKVLAQGGIGWGVINQAQLDNINMYRTASGLDPLYAPAGAGVVFVPTATPPSSALDTSAFQFIGPAGSGHGISPAGGPPPLSVSSGPRDILGPLSVSSGPEDILLRSGISRSAPSSHFSAKYHTGGELDEHEGSAFDVGRWMLNVGSSPAPTHKHAGGQLAHDEVPIIGQIGEFIHQTSAVEHYGVPIMHALNERRIPVEHLRFHAGDLVGAPGAGRGVDSTSRAGSEPKVHVALVDDHRQAKKYLESREGQKHILRVAEQLTRQ